MNTQIYNQKCQINIWVVYSWKIYKFCLMQECDLQIGWSCCCAQSWHFQRPPEGGWTAGWCLSRAAWRRKKKSTMEESHWSMLFLLRVHSSVGPVLDKELRERVYSNIKRHFLDSQIESTYLNFLPTPWHFGDVAHDELGCHRLASTALSTAGNSEGYH